MLHRELAGLSAATEVPPLAVLLCRYLSHFRSVHRGAYFAELRTTTVRKLLPESWGFLCPVHTPDGSPCGLLTHFTAACQIITHRPDNPEAVETALLKVGLLPEQMLFWPRARGASLYPASELCDISALHLPSTISICRFGRRQPSSLDCRQRRPLLISVLYLQAVLW